MKIRVLATAVLALVSAGLGGCALNASNIGAASQFVGALQAAGCSGTLHLSASATTAAMGVPSASLSNTFDGQCVPPGAAKPPPATTAAGAP